MVVELRHHRLVGHERSRHGEEVVGLMEVVQVSVDEGQTAVDAGAAFVAVERIAEEQGVSVVVGRFGHIAPLLVEVGQVDGC